MTEKVFIEDYKGFRIEFDKEEEEFKADNSAMDLHFTDRSLYQLKGQIKQSKNEPMQKEAFMETGYFHQQLTRINILSMNKETKEIRYKVIACSDNNDYEYPVGKMKQEDYERKQLMPVNDETIKAFENLKDIQEKIKGLEDDQEGIINEVSRKYGGKAL
jgi:hypothetical protein